MKRIKVKFKRPLKFKYLDAVHDALLKGISSMGVPLTSLSGVRAKSWNFAPSKLYFSKETKYYSWNEMMISTVDPEISDLLKNLKWENCTSNAPYREFLRIDPSDVIEENKIFGNSDTVINATFKMLSPTVFKSEDHKTDMKHITSDNYPLSLNIKQCANDIHSAGIEMLFAEWDNFYKERVNRCDIGILFKQQSNKDIFFKGTLCPLVIQAKEKDLNFLYHSGIGLKNRCGFGALEFVA